MKPPTKGTMEPQKHPSTPTLKRPQNRRDIFHKKSPYIQREAKLSLEDLDGIFDSYDDDDDEDLIPPFPVEETRAAQRPRGKVLQPAATSKIPDLDVVFNSPFKNRASFKTSSPIDTQSDVQHVMGRISPIPFNFEEEEEEEPERVLQKPTDLMHTFEVEPAPERIAFKKNLAPLMKVAPPQKGNGHVPAVSVVSLEPQKKVPEKKSNGLKENPAPSKKLVKPNIHTFEVEPPPEIPDPLKKVKAPHEETGPGASKTLKESKMPAEIRREKPKKKNGDKLVSAPSQEPQPPAQENPSKIPTLSKKVAAPQQENGHPPVMAGRLEKPQNTAQEKLKETPATSKNLAASDKEAGPRQKPPDPPVEKSSRGETNFHDILQKLKEARLSKPAPPMKVCLPIRAPTPPLEEEEFCIMEPPRYQLSRSRPRPKQGTTSNAEVKGSAGKFSKETQPEEAEKRQASGEAGTDRKIPPKERTAAEEQPKDRTTNRKEVLEMKKRGPKSKAGKDRPVKDNEFIQEPDYAVALQSQESDDSVALQSQEPPGKEHGGQTRVQSTKDARERIQEPDDSVELQSQEPPGNQHKAKSKAGKDRPVKDREFIQEPDYAVALQSQEPPEKEHGGQTRVQSTKDARKRIQEPDDSVELQSQEPPGNQHEETLHTETDVSLAEEIWNPGGGRKHTSKDVAAAKTENGRTQKRKINGCVSDRVVSGKRQRKPPGDWWLSHGLPVEEQDVDAMEISQREETERTQKKPSEPGQKANKVKDAPTKVRKKQHRTTGKTTAALSEQIPNQEDLQQHADYLDVEPVQSESLVCPLGEASITTGDCLFNKQASNAPKTIPDHVESRNIPKKKAVVGEAPENDVEIPAIQVQKPNPKIPKIRKKAQKKAVVSEVPENDVEIPAIQVQKPNPKSPKIRKKAQKNYRKKHPEIQGKILFPVQEEQASLPSDVSECPDVEVVATDITETSAECWPSENRFQDSTSAVAFANVQGFTSGPSSMIPLKSFEEQDTCLPSSVVHSALSATELCLFPLAPVALQAKDGENLTRWFSQYWPAIVKTAPQMNKDEFLWFSYRKRIIGVCEELLHDNWCVGKMILGSHAQKPLWVDHSATTVYNVLTSAVSVKLDGAVSPYNPGRSFAVPCGHAHSINNLTDEPAVLTFNRQRNQNAD